MSFPSDLHSAAVSDSHLPCHAPTMPFFSRPQHGRRETAVLCCGLENNGMVGAWHGHGMTSVNQTRPHCVNQMGKAHSKPLAVRHCRGTAWARHGNGMLCVNRPLASTVLLCSLMVPPLSLCWMEQNTVQKEHKFNALLLLL